MQMIAHVLLNGTVDPEMRSDFGIDLVPGVPHLTLGLAAKRREIFVQLLAVAAQRCSSPEAFAGRQVVEDRNDGPCGC